MSNSQPRDGAAALQLGKYRLIIELAQGGMGCVYLAVAQGPAGFNKLTVIKELKPSLLDEAGFLEMFLDEARLSARLSHANVVQTNEVGVEHGRAYLAMEYLDGQSLNRVRSRLGKARTLPLAADVRIVAQACEGLHYAHELRDFDGTPLGVVHRDVSPHNIFVTYDGQVKIVDFGVAKALSSSHESTAGVLKGKVAYMSPEQVLGTTVDRRADIFALGVILWESVAGKRLWGGMRTETIIARVMAADVPRLAAVAPDADPRLVAIVDRAMALSMHDRYPTADALRLDLEGWLATTRDGDYRAAAMVGAEMTRAFASERAQVSAAVSEQLRLLREAQGADLNVGLVRLGLAASGSNASYSGGASGSGSNSGSGSVSVARGASVAGGPSSTQVVRPAPVYNPSQPPGPQSGLTPSVGAARFGDQSSNVSMALPASHGAPGALPAPPPRGALGAVLAVSLLLLAAGGGGLALFVVRSKAAAVAVAPPASGVSLTASSASAPASGAPLVGDSGASEDSATIELTIRVTPPGARVFIDGSALPKSAQITSFKKDAVTHRVRAEAPGYITKTELVTFEQNTEVVLQLDHVGAPTAARPRGPGTAPEPKPDATGKAGKPQRPIDTELDPR
jgi:serine/threonine-protein kinase